MTLTSAGTIDQTAGVISAGTLTGRSVGGATLVDDNLVSSLGAFTDTGAGSTGIAFKDAQTLGTTGTVSSATGPISPRRVNLTLAQRSLDTGQPG